MGHNMPKSTSKVASFHGRPALPTNPLGSPRRRGAAACTTSAHARFTRQRSRGCRASPPGCGPIRPACSHARAGDADHPGPARPARRLARGRDDGDHGHHHGLRQGGLVVRARGRSRARPDGGRPAAVAQAAGKLLRASLGPAPAPHASGRAAWPRDRGVRHLFASRPRCSVAWRIRTPRGQRWSRPRHR